MINKIIHTKELELFISDTCEENNICVNMDESILKAHYTIIKVDRYYNSLHLGHLRKTPPSVDCLIALKCRDNEFVIYLVELKNIKSSKNFEIDNIYNKFKSTIENFMGSRFKKIFHNERYKIKFLHLYFVTRPYGEDEKSRRKEGTTKLDSLVARKPFKFLGKRCQIKHKIPDPIIKRC